MKLDEAGHRHTAAPVILRDALSRMAASVAVLTAGEPGRVRGVTLTSFVGLSLSPALAAFACHSGSRMLSMLGPGDLAGITVLAEDQEDMARRCAAPDRGTLPESALIRDAAGIPCIAGGIARFSLRLVSRQLTGDHTLVIGEVLDVTSSAAPPLIYHHRHYRQLAQPWPQGSAP